MVQTQQLEGIQFKGGGTRKYIVEAVENSLKSLDTDYIDLYQMHFPDAETPIEETLRTLEDLIQSGKVRYIGASNFNADQMSDSVNVSIENSFQSICFNSIKIQHADKIYGRRFTSSL